MEEEFSPVEEGTRGTVHFIDDIGQIHMLWDNKRTLPINTDTDKFRMLTPEECYEEKCQEKAERFYAALNKERAKAEFKKSLIFAIVIFLGL